MYLKIHENIKKRLNIFLNKNRIPNLLINGPNSCGKKTLVIDFINKIYKSDNELIKKYVMILNCTQDKGIKMIREELKFFSKMNSPNIKINENLIIKFKTIVLLNAEYLTIDAQSALRRSIELYSHSTRFILVVVNKDKILNPILSRVCDIYVPTPMIGGKVINLNNQINNKEIEKYNLERYNILKEQIVKLIDQSSILTPLMLKNTAKNLVENGFHLESILYVIENIKFERLNITRKKYIEILMILSNLKEYTISENLLIFNALFMFFISSNIKIENISFN
jgi:DNA polymerase III delta prime subunit